jgi:LacI family transcriptional regulator
MTEKLLREHPDLAGLYVAGGGITGTVEALRASGRANEIVTVGYELMDVTRAGLLDGMLTLVISHPLPLLADAAIAGMIRASAPSPDAGNQTTILPFEIFTRENI